MIRLFHRDFEMRFVISENELDAAICHLKNDAMSYATNMPRSWSKTLFKEHILQALAEVKKPALGVSFPVMHNIWAHLEPTGADLLRYPHQPGQLQIMLSFRTTHTQPEKLVSLGKK